MFEMAHVRFRLSELIRAVHTMLKGGPLPSAQEAMTYYLGWASSLGWELQAMSHHIDSATAIKVVERDDQVTIVSEEHWNVTWGGEDTAGCADLVAETAPATLVIQELKRNGWRRDGGRLVRLPPEGLQQQILLDDVQAVVEHHGLAGTAVNLKDIVRDLEIDALTICGMGRIPQDPE
jgi:hypothetical protein